MLRRYLSRWSLFSALSARKPLSGPYRQREQGFTLLEVMIALAILAVASAGLLTASSGHLRQTAQLEQRTVAAWALQNRISELRLSASAPAIGQSQSEAELAGRRFLLTLNTQATESPLLLRLDLRAYADEAGGPEPEADYALAQLTAFLRTER